MIDAKIWRREQQQKAYQFARQNLFDYTELMFPEAVPSDRFLAVKHTKLLAHALTRVVHGDVRRLLIAIPPRFGKSLLASVMLPTWLLGHDPSYKIICASYAAELARDFAVQSRNIMQSQIYRALFPGTKFTSDGTALGRLTTTAGGFRYMTSVWTCNGRLIA